MAWPNDPINVKVELYLGSSMGWVDISSYVLVRDGIRIRRGFSDESTVPEPSSCSMTLRNVDGRFTPRNPESPLYGLIGRNTPVRVSVALYSDGFDTAVTDGWGDDWTLTTIGGADADFDVAGGVGTVVVDDANEARTPFLTSRSFTDVEVRLTLDVDDLDITGADVGGGPILRVVDEDNFYWAVASIDTDEAVTLSIRERTSGVTATLKSESTSITWDGTPLRIAFAADRDTLKAKVWPTDEAEPADWMVETTDTTKTSGSAGVRVAAFSGNTDTPVEFSIDDFEVRSYRFHGEISEWPPQWDVANKDPRVHITAQGILRRLGQGNKPTTAAKSTILATDPVLYWPLDDGGLTQIGSSALAGGPTLTITEFVPTFGLVSDTTAARTAHPGVGKAVDFFDGGSLTGTFTMPDTGSWSVSFYASLLMTDTTTVPLATIRVGDSLYTVIIATSFNGIIVQITGASQMNSSLGIIPDESTDDPEPFHIVVTSEQSGSDIAFSLRVNGTEVDTTTLASTTNAPPHTVEIGPEIAPPDDSELLLGQFALYDEAFTDNLLPAFQGYPGEKAGTRAARLATEMGISLTIIGDADKTERMGTQLPETSAYDALLDAARTEMALVYESRHDLGLTFRTRRSLYNQSVALTLDYTDEGEVAHPLEPIDDDRYTRNDIDVERKDARRTGQRTPPVAWARRTRPTGSPKSSTSCHGPPGSEQMHRAPRDDDPGGRGGAKGPAANQVYAAIHVQIAYR